jgi:hypothetical protein
MAKNLGYIPLLQACEDPKLFGMRLWPAQRELLERLERGPERTHVWALGRRSSKTTMGGLFATWQLLFRPDLDAMVQPGEPRVALVVATNLAQGRLLVRMVRAMVERSPLLRPMLESASEDELRFEPRPGVRCWLQAKPCSSRGLRGPPMSFGTMDEAAHHLAEGELGNAATAERVFQALFPAVAQFGRHGRLLLSSTPYGTDGLFASLYRKGVAGELPDVAAVNRPSWEMNPTLDGGVLALEEARSPLDYQQEFGAQFLSPGDAYLDFNRISVADRPPLPAGVLAGPIVAGIDPSFASDPFGVVVLGRDPANRERLVVACARAIGGRDRDFEATMCEVSSVLREYGVARCVTDQYSSAAVVDRLARDGFWADIHTFTAQSKTAAYSEVRSRLYGGSLELYGRDPGGSELLEELRRLRTRFSVGSANVFSPRVSGSHGDLASALAVATYDQRDGPMDSGWMQESSGRTVARELREQLDVAPLSSDVPTADGWWR